jgi:hypothetical protein
MKLLKWAERGLLVMFVLVIGAIIVKTIVEEASINRCDTNDDCAWNETCFNAEICKESSPGANKIIHVWNDSEMNSQSRWDRLKYSQEYFNLYCLSKDPENWRYDGENNSCKVFQDGKVILETKPDWQTYENKAKGYSIKMPKDWSAVEKNNRLYVENTNQLVNEAFHIKTENINLEEYIKQYKALGNSITNQEPYQLDGIEGVMLIAKGQLEYPQYIIFATRNNTSYAIYFSYYDDMHKEILSTFKFIENVKIERANN